MGRPLDPDEQVSTASAVNYWSNVPATIDGMLGGYPQVSRIDLRGSLSFIEKLRRSRADAGTPADEPRWLARGVDCGAGIGRITQGALMRVCNVVDIVEPIANFANEAKKACTDDADMSQQLGQVYVAGLQDWHPQGIQYDLIWNQWCLGHLKNEALVEYLRQCKQVLAPGGWIVAKENISPTVDDYDDLDSSVPRTDATFLAVFEEAGLKVVRTELQHGLPKALGLFPVRSYALQPAD